MILQRLRTKIFLDSGDIAETKEAIKLLGFLDGQTTNPSLIAKSPDAQERLARGEKFSETEVYEYYKKVVTELSGLIPNGSISVEVYADANTTAEQMLKQGREMNTWIPNAHIKLPTTTAGLETAEKFIADGIKVNLTLCFSQEQAAAVYAATRGAKKGDVFVSPFIGRLDDRGENGLDLIKNILQMYKTSDGHVEVLTASVRNLDHFNAALKIKSDIITAPLKILQEWAEQGLLAPADDFIYNSRGLTAINYQSLNLEKSWDEFNLKHELTEQGIAKFAQDWNNLIK
ncbi:MAG: transaldolase family protein [bacterium]|nr:transaldolase family protein [bacterium]